MSREIPGTAEDYWNKGGCDDFLFEDFAVVLESIALFLEDFFCFDFAAVDSDTPASGSGNFPASNWSNSSSFRMVTPSERALSYFEPGSEPTTT